MYNKRDSFVCPNKSKNIHLNSSKKIVVLKLRKSPASAVFLVTGITGNNVWAIFGQGEGTNEKTKTLWLSSCSWVTKV